MASLIKRLTQRTDRGLHWEVLSRVWVTLGVFLLPVLVLSWTNDTWETTKALVLLVTVGLGWLCYFMATLVRREHRWTMSRLDWIVVALWLTYGISTLGSVSVWTSLTGISGDLTEAFPVVTAFIGLYFLTGQVFRTEVERRAGWGAMLAGVGLALVFQMFQFSDFSLLPPSLPRANTVFSTISNSLTDVAILAAVFGSMLLFFWQAQAERWQRWSITAGVLLSWLVVMLAGRPVGWAVWAIGMIAVVLQQAAKGKKADTRMIVVAVILAAAGMSAQLFGLHRQAGLNNGPDITLDQATSRAIVGKVITSRPVFGTGGATWYQDFVTKRPASFNESVNWSTRFIKANNGWWESIATSGLVGALLWLGVLGLSIWTAWTRWAKKGETEWMVYGLVALTTLITGMFTTWSLPLLGMTWFFLGLQRAAVHQASSKKAQTIGLGFPLAFALTALVIVSTWFFAGRIYAAEVMVRQTQNAINRREDLGKIVDHLDAALKLNKHQGDASVLLAGAYATQAELALQKNDSTTATPLVQKAVAVMRTAVANDPKNPAMIEAANNLLNRLNAYVADAVDEASRNFQALRKLEPTNPIHDVGYGQTVMILRGRLLTTDATDAQKKQGEKYLQDALAAYASALKKKADYPQAVFAEAQAYGASGQPAKAASLLTPLLKTYPQIPVFWLELAKAQSDLKQNDVAVTSFKQAISLAPTDPTAYLDLSAHYQNAGQLDLAKSTLEEGIKAASDTVALKQKLEELNKPKS